jgi:hypothetical protein
MSVLLTETRDRLAKYSRGWIVSVMLLLTLAVYTYMLTTTIPLVMQHSHGMELLDMQPTGYTVEYAKALFKELGESGRYVYLHRQIPADMVYPFLFAVTYSLLLTYIFRKAFSVNSRWHTLVVVPIFAGAFDYLENLGIIYHLESYPQLSDNMIRLTNFCSVAKSIFTMLFFALLFVGLAKLAMRWLSHRTT